MVSHTSGPFKSIYDLLTHTSTDVIAWSMEIQISGLSETSDIFLQKGKKIIVIFLGFSAFMRFKAHVEFLTNDMYWRNTRDTVHFWPLWLFSIIFCKKNTIAQWKQNLCILWEMGLITLSKKFNRHFTSTFTNIAKMTNLSLLQDEQNAFFIVLRAVKIELDSWGTRPLSWNLHPWSLQVKNWKWVVFSKKI